MYFNPLLGAGGEIVSLIDTHTPFYFQSKKKHCDSCILSIKGKYLSKLPIGKDGPLDLQHYSSTNFSEVYT